MKKLAFEGIRSNKLLLSDNIVTDSLIGDATLKSIEDFGLLKKEESGFSVSGVSYGFIHLSFMEYLSATYILESFIKGDNEAREIANYLASQRYNSKYFMILKFLSGAISNYYMESLGTENEEGASSVLLSFCEIIVCNLTGLIVIGSARKAGLYVKLMGQLDVKALQFLRENMTSTIEEPK